MSRSCRRYLSFPIVSAVLGFFCCLLSHGPSHAGITPFAFQSVIDAPTGASITSESVSVSGIDSPTPISISNGEYELNGSGIWTGASGTVVNGDTVRVRVSSAASDGTTSVAMLTIGDQTAPFAVTTSPRVTIVLSSSPPGGGNVSGGGDHSTPAFRRPYLEIIGTDGSVVTFRPTGGANDGTDQGGLTSGKDAGIYQYELGTNTGSSEFLFVWQSDCNEAHGYPFLQWDISSLPLASEVAKVSVVSYHWVHSYYFAYPIPTTTMNVLEPLGPWDEMTLTWNANPGYSPTVLASAVLPVPQVQFTAYDGPLAIDITTLYREWQDGSRPNHGIVLSRSELFCENGNAQYVYSSDYAGMNFSPGYHDVIPSVEVTATASPGYEFVSWTEGETVVSTATTYTFVPTTDHTLVANFAAGDDQDGDGIADSLDNCPTVGNPDQIDTNNNDVGDLCEVTAAIALTVPASDPDGTYSVVWDATVERGSLYTLQESSNPDFSGATQVYSGTAKRVRLKDRISGATYHYRVRLTVPNVGTGPWYYAGNGCDVVDVVKTRSNAGGTISPAGSVTIPVGEMQAFAITPSVGYHIVSLLVDGALRVDARSEDVAPYSYTTTYIVDAPQELGTPSRNKHTIKAEFKVNRYQVTAGVDAAGGGTVKPMGVKVFKHDKATTYTITPDAGRIIAAVLVNGMEHEFTTLPSGVGKLTLTITKNTAIVAKFQ